MPIKKSAKKYMKSSRKRNEHNVLIKKQMRQLVKKVRDYLKSNDLKKATESVREAVRSIDRAAGKKIIKKNTASRKKSRLASALKKATKKQ